MCAFVLLCVLLCVCVCVCVRVCVNKERQDTRAFRRANPDAADRGPSHAGFFLGKNIPVPKGFRRHRSSNHGGKRHAKHTSDWENQKGKEGIYRSFPESISPCYTHGPFFVLISP
jgi:uncharacterized protein YgiB involved in biofilm formation